MVFISILVVGLLIGWFVQTNLGRFRLGCWVFNDPYDECLDLMLQKCLNHGIRSISLKNQCWITIEFGNGVILKGWNFNRWYAWLHQGSLGEYQWADARPSANTMADLRREIKYYYTGI